MQDQREQNPGDANQDARNLEQKVNPIVAYQPHDSEYNRRYTYAGKRDAQSYQHRVKRGHWAP